jgi:RES domain-containing protein
VFSDDAASWPRRPLSWTDAVRIQPWRHPETTIWADLADSEDVPGLLAILALTEPSVLRSLGDLDRVSGAELMRGPGAGWAMPAFTWGGAGRFNPPGTACFYAARERPTAIAETVHHQERFLRATAEPPIELRMRVLHATLATALALDLVGHLPPAGVLDPEDYTRSHVFGAAARIAGADAITYPSVRAEGQCAAVFQPRVIQRCASTAPLTYLWDGRRISAVEERTLVDW